VKLIHDTRFLFGRCLRQTQRNPIWVVLGLFQPLLYLLLFAPLLDRLAGAPGFDSNSAFDVFTPGLLVMIAVYGTAFVGYGLIAELRSGLVERLRVTPANRPALVLSMVLRDVLAVLLQMILLAALATLMGLRANLIGLLLTFGLSMLVGITMAAVSYSLALTVKDENGLASMLNTFMLPLLLLSGIMLPLVLAPPVLQAVAALNPLSHAVEAARAMTNGQLNDASVLPTFALIGFLALLTLTWAVRAFRNAMS